jgi:transcriptional regulator with XRE-family HTH domain
MKKIDLRLDFDKIRSRIDLERESYKPGAWAELIGVSLNVVSNIHGKTKQNPSLEYIVAVSKATGRSVDYYLFGHDQESPQPQKKEYSKITKVIIEHQDIVKKFKNPEIAKAMNEKLLEIEAADAELFSKADAYIQGLHDSIKTSKKKKTKRSTG